MITIDKFMEYCWCRDFDYAEMIWQANNNFNVDPPTKEYYSEYRKKREFEMYNDLIGGLLE